MGMFADVSAAAGTATCFQATRGRKVEKYTNRGQSRAWHDAVPSAGRRRQAVPAGWCEAAGRAAVGKALGLRPVCKRDALIIYGGGRVSRLDR